MSKHAIRNWRWACSASPQPYAHPFKEIQSTCVATRPHLNPLPPPLHSTISHHFLLADEFPFQAHISLPLVICAISQDPSPLTFPTFSSLPCRSTQRRRENHWQSIHLPSDSSNVTPSNPSRMSSKNKHALSMNLLTAESRNHSILSSPFCIRFPPLMPSATLSV
jgi:hypothetical protein